MKILHLSTPMTWRGGEQQVAYLVDGLESCSVKNFVFSPVDSALSKRLDKTQSSRLIGFKHRSPFHPHNIRILGNAIKKYDFDIIHAHDSHAHTMASLALSVFALEKPFVLSRKIDKNLKKNFFTKWKYNHPQLKHIISTSTAVNSKLKIIVNPSRISNSIIPDGIDIDRFNKQTAENINSVFNIPQTRFIIGYIAAHSPEKDHGTFIKVASILISKGLKAHFVLLGNESKITPNIEALISKSNLAGHFAIAGFRKDVDQLLPQFDFHLSTSLSEGFGSSILDAMAAGVPTVSTKVGGIVDFVEHKKNGILAPPKNAEKIAEQILDLINNPMLNSIILQNGLETARMYDYQLMAKKTYEVYRLVIEEEIY